MDYTNHGKGWRSVGSLPIPLFATRYKYTNTNINKYTNTQIHRTVGSLPLPLYATRGANVAGVFYLAGGYVGELHKHKCRLRLESVMTKLLIV